jgi:ABC-type Zn2+ transport system substrate-binding protein/surface adhesin
MRNSLFYFLLLTLTACASSEATDPLLEEAAALHEKGLQAEEALRPLLDSLEQRHNQISVQGRALTEAEKAFLQSTQQLQQRYQRWSDERIEVPGFEHAHDHEHDHDHDHTHGKKMPEATPEHMRNIQQESLDSILVLEAEAEALLAQ